jgi:hypothetical protein
LDAQVFEYHNVAMVLGVYMFTFKDAYEDKSDWIAMLIKVPGSEEPRISFNNFLPVHYEGREYNPVENGISYCTFSN